MKKAFIFDMDGVIINSEPVWTKYEAQFMPQLMGKDVYAKIKNSILGNSIVNIYDEAASLGFQMPKEEFLKIYNSFSQKVYQEALFTPGFNDLLDKLSSDKYKIALVSVSNQRWIDIVLERLNKDFDCIISLDSSGLETKPSPAGYIKTMSLLSVEPTETIILEDSQKGIDSAKASGAYTICLLENLPKNYIPSGANMYVKTIEELVNKLNTIKL